MLKNVYKYRYNRMKTKVYVQNYSEQEQQRRYVLII